ncbi:hypothetical protein [Dawidia soli]|uniref:Uncharacterized protein n=1 Tax=Dawidia soli TaxID=2782352 RepID=A0AAP2DE34_9BACT|nr:hypothetical protein [Dawidia soli]MBT1690058.1 hypothetical protein [Dawidia soli]
MKDFYTAQKPNLSQMQTLSKSLSAGYSFDNITVRKKNGELELMFIGGTRDNVTMYLNPENLDLTAEYPVEGCSAAVLQNFRAMYQDTRLRGILELFNETNPNAILITHKGIFIALGRPLKHPNKTELEGGILMTFEPGFTDRNIVEKIDTDVYLYDTLVY